MDVHRWIGSLSLALVLAACGAEDQPPEGSYSIDRELFLDQALAAMQQHGLVPAGAENVAREQLRRVRMDIDLEPGGVFKCRMDAAGQSHEYAGSWKLTGDRIRIEQRHEDGEEVDDQLIGTLRGGMLDLVHDEMGMKMPYVLRRGAGTPASPR